jgi:hypothetical protein
MQTRLIVYLKFTAFKICFKPRVRGVAPKVPRVYIRRHLRGIIKPGVIVADVVESTVGEVTGIDIAVFESLVPVYPAE